MESGRGIRIVVISLFLAASTRIGWCNEPKELPDPLTLHTALSSIDDSNPVVNTANAAVTAAQALESVAASANDLSAQIEARARWIEPSKLASDQSQDDSVIQFKVAKRLYDFGNQRNSQLAAQKLRISREYALVTQHIDLQLNILDA